MIYINVKLKTYEQICRTVKGTLQFNTKIKVSWW